MIPEHIKCLYLSALKYDIDLVSIRRSAGVVEVRGEDLVPKKLGLDVPVKRKFSLRLDPLNKYGDSIPPPLFTISLVKSVINDAESQRRLIWGDEWEKVWKNGHELKKSLAKAKRKAVEALVDL